MDIWIVVVVVVVALSVGGSGRRSICILERLNQVSWFPGPERERETLDSTRTPADNCVYDIAQNTRQDETKDRHSTAVKKWDLCGVSLRQRENVMRFYDFISDNRPWNLMDTTWGSLVCCSAPPLPNSHCHFNFFGLTNKFEFVFRAFSWIFVHFPCAWWAAAAAVAAAKRKLHTN